MPDVLRLFDALVFNYLVGISDAHGKNFSFLYGGGGAKLAPLYDLVCPQAYENLAPELAMKIGDERKPKRIGPKNWHKFFKDAGIGRAPAGRRLLILAKRIEQETRVMIQENHAGAESVSPIVLGHCRHLLAQQWGEQEPSARPDLQKFKARMATNPAQRVTFSPGDRGALRQISDLGLPADLRRESEGRNTVGS